MSTAWFISLSIIFAMVGFLVGNEINFRHQEHIFSMPDDFVAIIIMISKLQLDDVCIQKAKDEENIKGINIVPQYNMMHVINKKKTMKEIVMDTEFGIKCYYDSLEKHNELGVVAPQDISVETD